MIAAPEDYALGPSPADWETLEKPLQLDPVTFEILRHKLEAVNEEQAIALKDVSVSPIVTAASDFNNAIYTADGRIASMGPQVVFHSGAMPIVLRYVMEAFPPDEIAPGDMFAVNDPYYGAVHHPDVSVVAPIHHEGRLIAWAGVAAHQVDMGGMSVGSISAGAREKYQEGLMMPPIKLVEGGVLRQDVWRLILNMTRQPQMVGLDLRGFIASNGVARERLLELVARYGADTITTAMEELIRYSERRMRERLRSLPDGTFHTRGFLDHDGVENKVYPVDVRLEKEGDVLRFDMRGSSPQAPTYINCTEGALIGAIFGGTAPILGAGIPWNHGILGALEVIAPKGLIVNAQRPAATGAATVGQGWTIMSVSSHAVSKLLAFSEELRQPLLRHHPRDVRGAVQRGSQPARRALRDPAHRPADRRWRRERRRRWDRPVGRARGAAPTYRQRRDQRAPRPDAVPVPHLLPRHRRRRDVPRRPGRGHGLDAPRGRAAAQLAHLPRRRGAGVLRPVRRLARRLQPPADRARSRVHACLARGALPLQNDVLAPLDLEKLGGEIEILEAKVPEFGIVPGDVVLYTWQGGGGYGDPLDRDERLVHEDLALGIISEEKARDVYGVPGDRDALRRARLTGPTAPAEPAAGVAEVAGRIGVALLLTRGAPGAVRLRPAPRLGKGRLARRLRAPGHRASSRVGSSCTPRSSSSATCARPAGASTGSRSPSGAHRPSRTSASHEARGPHGARHRRGPGPRQRAGARARARRAPMWPCTTTGPRGRRAGRRGDRSPRPARHDRAGGHHAARAGRGDGGEQCGWARSTCSSITSATPRPSSAHGRSSTSG